MSKFELVSLYLLLSKLMARTHADADAKAFSDLCGASRRVEQAGECAFGSYDAWRKAVEDMEES